MPTSTSVHLGNSYIVSSNTSVSRGELFYSGSILVSLHKFLFVPVISVCLGGFYFVSTITLAYFGE